MEDAEKSEDTYETADGPDSWNPPKLAGWESTVYGQSAKRCGGRPTPAQFSLS